METESETALIKKALGLFGETRAQELTEGIVKLAGELAALQTYGLDIDDEP